MANKPNEGAPHAAFAADAAFDPDWRVTIDPSEYDAVGTVRDHLDIEDDITDLTIASSLAAIAAKGDPRARWLAAFTSPLGKWLAQRGTDLNTALNVMMANAPKSS